MNETDARSFVAERCSAAAMQVLEKFVEALIRANGDQNLIARSTIETIWTRHIADSAQLLDLVPCEAGLWMDIGSGPGLPGIVLAAMRHGTPFLLVESRRRRTEWLRRMIAQLSLSNCEVFEGDIGKAPPRRAGVITARAFAPLPRLIALSARFSTKQTHWVLPKGRSAAQEIGSLSSELRPMFHVKPSATDPEAGIIVGQGAVRLHR